MERRRHRSVVSGRAAPGRPARSSRWRAAARPRAAGSGPASPGSSSTRWRRTTLPSSDASSASRRSRPSGRSTACAPAGRSQSPPSSARKPARRRRAAGSGACSIAARRAAVAASPCAALDRERALRRPGAASPTRSRTSAMWSASPSRSSATAATTMASKSAALASRVAMLPRSPANVRSGRRSTSCARRRADPVAMRAPGRQAAERQPDQRVAGVAPLGHRGQHEARHGGRRQVLGRVHGEVGPPVEHRGLHLLDEHALAAQLPDRDVEPLVGHRLDDDELDVEAGLGGPEQRGHVLGLPAGQRAAARGDAERSGSSRHADADPSVSRVRGRTESRSASARRSPLGVPAASLSRTVGSCSSLATMPRVSASTASRWRSSRPSRRDAEAVELGRGAPPRPARAARRRAGRPRGRSRRRRSARARRRRCPARPRPRRDGARCPTSAKRRRSSMSSSVTPGRSGRRWSRRRAARRCRR